jgi:myo-inositol-1(or 4)-monophosphatase
LVADAAEGLVRSGIERLRAIGSIALTLCYVASGRLDGMVALGGCRSVDIAAGQLILREVGGAVAFTDVGAGGELAMLDLLWRSRMVAAAGTAGIERLSLVGGR